MRRAVCRAARARTAIAAALSSRCRHWERNQQPCPRYRSLSACTDVEDVAVCGARGEFSPADNATRRIMKRFKSARQAQRFLSVHDQVANLFHVPTPESIPARGANEIHRWRPSELSPGCAAALYLRSRRPGLTCRRFRIARGRRSKHRVGPQNLEKSVKAWFVQCAHRLHLSALALVDRCCNGLGDLVRLNCKTAKYYSGTDRQWRSPGCTLCGRPIVQMWTNPLSALGHRST